MKVKILGLPKSQAGGSIFQNTVENFINKGPMNNSNPPPAPKLQLIEDKRKIDGVNGKPISGGPLSKKANPDFVKRIIIEARNQKVDPYTALAVAYQETGLNNDADAIDNPFHILSNNFSNKADDDIVAGIKTLKGKIKYGKSLGKKDEASILQAYNGYGIIGKNTEGTQNKFYGVEIGNGLNMSKNPLYGKRIIDVRDNILKKNKFINDLVNTDYKQNQDSQIPSKQYGGKVMKVKILGIPKHQAGGKTPIVNGLPPGMEHMANIEAEAGEVYQDRSGGINKISDQAPSHEQGGAFIPNAQRVLEDTSIDRKDKGSKALKMSPDEVHTIFGVKPKRPLSHAKAYEFVKGEYGKDVERYEKAQAGLNDKPNFDRTKYNTAKLNFVNREDIPTDQDVFDTLFEHQEAIKAVHGIENDGKTNKYGGWKMPKHQAGGSDDTPDFGLYHGPKYPQDKSNVYTPTGKTSEAKLTDKQIADAYKAVGQNFNGLKGGKLQSAIYNYLVDSQPDVLRQTLKEYGANKKALVGKAGNLKAFKDPENASADDLKKAIPYLVDQMPGARIPLPSSQTDTDKPGTPQTFNPTQPATPQPGGPANPAAPTPQLSLHRGQASGFHEDTNWYDLAPGEAELAGSFTRDPELYNPVQIHELKYKQLDPTAALRANQGDYNAALHALDTEHLGSGSRAANISNLTAEKYKANNQISAEYENANAGIKNKETEYNTQARDRQSMADAGSRKEFYANVLQSRDNQRLQRLQAIQDLSRVQQLKARQNRSGNLILQTTPHFDQNGQYNGNQYVANLPPDLMGDGTFIPQPPSGKKPVAPKNTTTTTWKIGDRVYKNVTQNPNE